MAAPPERDEAGTPCVLGAIAVAEALEALGGLGWEAVAAHEGGAAAVLHQHLRQVPGLTLYGDAGPFDPDTRLGVFPFNLGNLPHGLVAAVLDHEWGIGVRSGCFCAHPYVKSLLGLTPRAIERFESRSRAGDHSDQPGMVRASVGLASTRTDAERLVTALHAIQRGEHGEYREDHHGTWAPVA